MKERRKEKESEREIESLRAQETGKGVRTYKCGTNCRNR